MPNCPAISCDGKMVKRRSRFGKTFYSCSNFPDCDVIVNDLAMLSEKYPSHPKTPYVKKERYKKRGKAEKAETPKKKGKKESKPRAQKTYSLSPELKAVVGDEELSRPEVIKRMWDYIKEHKCQDPKNKRLIVPDAKLAKVFGSKTPIDMMKLSGILGKHLS